MTTRTHTEPAPIMPATLHERKRDLMEERRTHAFQTEATPGMEGTYTTSNEQAAFFTLDSLMYYERLTGHIEELDYLIAASKLAKG